MFEAQPDEEETAAALAAISWYLAREQEAQVDQSLEDWRWKASGFMVHQGVRPSRLPYPPAWGTVERIRRSGPGGTGIIGQ